MKSIISILIISAVLVSCQKSMKDEGPNPATEAFKRNSETVKKDIKNWQNETPDYSIFADGFYFYPTQFSTELDSVSLADAIEEDKQTLAMLDFELIGDLVLLPGVNADTKEVDGSVRYYGQWKVTKSATDSTEARSGVLDMYASYDFNDEGKVTNQVMYGDFSGLMGYLNKANDADGE
ncbi:MAG TPA: hypothetical protein PKL31_11150 [Fulvivirga sp.]|nr:hypothetical protein [Fulvivirga sp.]